MILHRRAGLVLAALAGCSGAPAAGGGSRSGAAEPAASALFLGGHAWVKAVSGFSKIYDPSEGESQPWYFNDHTFVRDDGGRWHLFGISHSEPAIPLLYEVENEDAFGHASATTLADPASWRKVTNAALTASGTETHLWAPHVVRGPDALYYMFYAGGGADGRSQQINYATSTDLSAWSKQGTIFSDGYQARDPMMLWDEGEQRWIMYYTATEDPGTTSRHVVAYRTCAPDFTGWSERGIAFLDARKGTDAGSTESPFVLEHGGSYYLFIGPQPYHFPYIPPDFPGTDVFVSDVATDFSARKLVGHIAAHAAEVVDDGTKLWVSDTGWARGGVYLAELGFFAGPASGSRLYARAADKGVWTYDGTSRRRIGRDSDRLFTSGFGVFSLDAQGLQRFNFDANATRTPVSAPATSFVVNATGLYRQDRGVSKWDAQTQTWTTIADRYVA